MLSSLHARLLVVAGVVLTSFLGTAALVLDHGFRDSARDAVQERLKAQIFVLLGLADLDTPARVLNDALLPDTSLATPESGHYAQIHDADGRVLWRSRSMLGLAIQWPGERAAGNFVFEEAISSAEEPLFCLSYLVQWESRDEARARPYTFQSCEGRGAFDAQVRRFQRRMWLWFGGLAAFLLAIQLVILRWGLGPLRQIASELTAIEAGEKQSLSGRYPRELQAVASNLNALLAARDTHLQRYRNALGDLAHSLKTPLAVIRSTLERGTDAGEVAEALREPVDQLDATIKYQLQRAATAGRSALSRPVPVAPVLDRLIASLRKVYHSRDILITGNAPADAMFYGDQGDLMEIIGNLADNACKWARREVRVEVLVTPAESAGKRPGLCIRIHDDGPGLPAEKVLEVMQRGARLDQSVEGHGIGLATVREIVEGAYSGRLTLASDHGGTVAEARLTFT